jgi:hypothetical protein
MIAFEATIEQFREKGEKTGWTYIDVPLDIAEKLKPSNKKAFRVRGKLDTTPFKGISLSPMGEGNFIMALNAGIRKKLRKQKGSVVWVQMQEDKEERPLSGFFLECLREDPPALDFFNTLPKSHQRYFSNWVEAAKTDATKTKRVAQSLQALSVGMGYGEMIRMNKKKSNLL